MDPEPQDQITGYWYADDDSAARATRVLTALRMYRSAETAMRRRTSAAMRMNETDMAALRFLLQRQKQGRAVTPKDLALRLGISSASTTVLIDRLAKTGHVERQPHPTDRRALILVASENTDEEVRRTLGGMHERMQEAAERLSRSDADAVVGFLDDLRAAVDHLESETEHPASGSDGSTSGS